MIKQLPQILVLVYRLQEVSYQTCCLFLDQSHNTAGILRLCGFRNAVIDDYECVLLKSSP